MALINKTINMAHKLVCQNCNKGITGKIISCENGDNICFDCYKKDKICNYCQNKTLFINYSTYCFSIASFIKNKISDWLDIDFHWNGSFFIGNLSFYLR